MSNRLWDKKQNAFREAIKEIRTNIDLKQTQLAKKLRKPQSYVSKYERGERKLDFIEVLDICKVCDVSIDEFVSIYSRNVK